MNPYVSLAKEAVEDYVKEKKVINPLGEFSDRKSGVFVTIKKNGQLRGCIGTYLSTKENINEEIIHNAIAAATEDYRFGPIQEEELSFLSYTVYILNKPEAVKNTNELDPKKYGIIVKTVPISHPDGTDVMFTPLEMRSFFSSSQFSESLTGFNGHAPPKSGLLLPDLKEIDTVEQQLSIACQKGNIDPTNEKIIIYRFTVDKYE